MITRSAGKGKNRVGGGRLTEKTIHRGGVEWVGVPGRPLEEHLSCDPNDGFSQANSEGKEAAASTETSEVGERGMCSGEGNKGSFCHRSRGS